MEFLALAAAGFVVARVALRQTDERIALAQGMVIGPALWGLIVNFVLCVLPGRAGALAGWVVLLALDAGMIWQTPHLVRPKLRTVAGFAAVALAVFWVALAARQLLQIPDADIHLGPSAFIRAGGWPLVLPWIPDQPLIYHYGVDLLVGLLAPPFGPDLLFTTEVLGAYVWTSFALVVATLLHRCAGWISLLALAPLLLTDGAWTLVGIPPPDILEVPVPTGLPAAGARSALGSLYWPDVSLQWHTEHDAAPPNIWKPPFVLAYALTIIVLTWSASKRPRSWPAMLTMAALVGFLGLLGEEVALVVVALWGLLEVAHVFALLPLPSVRAYLRLPSLWRTSAPSQAPDGSKQRISPNTSTSAQDGARTQAGRAALWGMLLRAAAGPMLAALLLVIGGGPISALLSGVPSGTFLGWLEDPGSRRPFGTLLHVLPGGVGLLGLGVVPVAACALLLAWRQRLVLAFVAGSGAFMLAALSLQHPAFQLDVTRMDGHARNFALLALLVALSRRLPALRPRWRYAAGVLVLTLITWPTVAASVRTLGLEVGHGIELSNAQPSHATWDPESESNLYYEGKRYALPYPLSDPVARYILDHTSVDARILSPHPLEMTITTGRPNASGFVGLLHLFSNTGPDYEDALRYLEPAAVRRLGVTYVHMTNAWVAALPDSARRWLADPQLFEPLVQGTTEALYRIRPTFPHMDSKPAPQSFEALRRMVPASATVRLIGLAGLDAARVASTLAHARMVGEVDPSGIHLLSDIPTAPVSGRRPDVVVVARERPFSVSLHAFPPIWWNRTAVAYATRQTIAPAIDPPPQPEADVVLHMSDVQRTADRITFAATLIDHAPEQWTGQDWLVISGHALPWAFPTEADDFTVEAMQWFGGQVVPGGGPATHVYEFDVRMNRLAVRDANGDFVALPSSAAGLPPGAYVLAVRLQQDYLQASIIPVMKIVISEAQGVSYTVYEDELGGILNPCPERLANTDSCRQQVTGH